MIISYNEDYEKIAMGLLSYIPDLKEPNRLESELEWYNSQDNRKIYLWRSEETQNLVAVIGLEVESEAILIRHIAVDPSYRNEGITYMFLNELQERYSDKNLVSTLETANIISNWQKKKNE